ncbi:MAG TPA: hypothetical protein VI461_13870, partial [Chitinophagaceae bacterium]|nr:hypothetical protein [Chitinophagaceae bacterium]
MKNIFKKYPLFPWLLPFFFVMHGFTENYDFVPVKDALLLIGLYLLSSAVMYFIGWLFYKNIIKAAIFSFLAMAFHFFFGSLQDVLRNLFPDSFVTKYVFILPVSSGLFILVFILLKKRKKPLLRICHFLNILLALLILIDLIWLSGKIISTKNDTGTLSTEFVACNDCAKPDIYLIIADEYAGNTELKDIFHFDNMAFTSQLAQRGFRLIPNSAANYNFTPYSIASTLNMDYLDLQRTGKQPLLSYTYETIRNNQFLRFLHQHQYKFYNYSFFDFRGQPTYTQETFLPNKTRLITGQTFLSRIEKEIGFHLVTKFKWKKGIKKDVYFNRDNNEKLFRLTLQTAGDKIKQPKFVLTHLMMPHYPYYYDKDGKEFPFETLVEGKQLNQQNYIEYLQYGNKKLIELIDSILKNSATPPIIILMGDHGFRHFNEEVDPKYFFSNLVSIHLPDKNYLAFNDSLTNVNLLRAV